jgi:hypothetical protein
MGVDLTSERRGRANSDVTAVEKNVAYRDSSSTPLGYERSAISISQVASCCKDEQPDTPLIISIC